MSDLLELMAAPFAACVVLVGIHAYLGMHVIQRKVIFVDLALAQIAALGATFSFLLGMSPHGRAGYFFALSFAIVGAKRFSSTSTKVLMWTPGRFANPFISPLPRLRIPTTARLIQSLAP